MTSQSIFISSLLPERFPDIAKTLRQSLGAKLWVIPGTKDIWCRDFMPVPVPGNGLVQFRYDPDYLRRYPKLRTDDGAGLLKLRNCTRSDLVIDGGNIVRFGDTAILTDKAFSENPHHARSKLRGQLMELLKVAHLIIIPVEPGDIFGHSDGVLTFVDDKTLLVNDYRRVARDYGKQLYSLLRRNGFELVPFPYRPTDKVLSGIASAEGVYINFLQTKDRVFLPTYGQHADDEAIRTLEGVMPGKEVAPIRCNQLARKGGALHCVTCSEESFITSHADVARRTGVSRLSHLSV